MIKRILITLLTLTVFQTSVALAHSGPGGKHRSPVEFLTEELDLSDDQANAITTLFEDSREECEAFSGHEARRECMMEQKETIDAEIKKLLNNEQLEAFTELQEKRERKFKHRDGSCSSE